VPVQLVVLNRAPADLVHRVLRDGVLLLDRDPGARIRFEVRTCNLYTDPDLVAKTLAFIETRLRELSTLARLDRIREDLKEGRFVTRRGVSLRVTEDLL
jgi:hypothetical protein